MIFHAKCLMIAIIIAGISSIFILVLKTSDDAKFEAACEKKGFVGMKTLDGQNRCVEAVYQEDLD